MNDFDRWFMKRVIAKETIQGWKHCKKIEALYALIRKVCEEEFTEDNAPTMDAFLRERFEATQYASYTCIPVTVTVSERKADALLQDILDFLNADGGYAIYPSSSIHKRIDAYLKGGE